jgi:hypothetical protein
MASLHRQLILQGLPLPDEMIRAIKDYTFMDVVQSDSKNKKDFILRHVARTQWCGKARPMDECKGITLFWMEEFPEGPQFQMTFCCKCGNYKSNMNPTYKTTCLC